MRKLVVNLMLCHGLLLLCVPTPLRAANGPAGAVMNAKKLIADREFVAASSVLEEALPEASGADRSVVLRMLVQTYEALIRQADSEGRTRDAALYRDNLAIIGRIPDKPAGPKAEQPVQGSRPSTVQPQKMMAESPGSTQGIKVPRAPRDVTQPEFQELPPLPRSESQPVEPVDPGPPGSSKSSEGSTEDRPFSARDIEVIASAPANGRPESKAPALPEAPDSSPSSRLGMPTPQNSAEAGTSVGVSNTTVPSSQKAASSNLVEADRLFTAKKYEEAGTIYARLARENILPADRRRVWAYCRWVAIVARINRHPRTSREWDEIDVEIQSVQKLTPDWYGDYLKSVVAEGRRGVPSSGRRGALVVRGADPDEPRSRRTRPHLPGRPTAQGQAGASQEQPLNLPAAPTEAESSGRTRLMSPQSPGNLAAPGPANAPEPVTPEAVGNQAAPSTPAASGDNPAEVQSPRVSDPRAATWQVLETHSFRIFHHDPATAAGAAEVAEATRTREGKKWGNGEVQRPWAPRCDIYLYPTAADFARMTGQSEASPGFSTMGMNSGKIIARRVNLRVDHPQILTSVLPHEVTHVVMADLFKEQQIPRWADEGIAVLAEPSAEQLSRTSELSGPLAAEKVFKIRELMSIDLPNEQDWALYYAQSVSLTQFFVDQRSPREFIAFVRSIPQDGVEKALRSAYGIEGFAQLEERWSSYARRQSAVVAATGDGSEANGGANQKTRR